ncbi:hypothetical protein SAMN07250955_103317 [Arboricoccus pini]|uniref:Uncharacterized protein n=1 Tax=Arboricoccus pini TaxID=1963835 RepID=A0A212QUW4_9PROT|nr:hypothetical protein [Arboricoccus pini]SNB63364.1 hypothetical protein SAMN07250955_103317 [Arboricoccus pini]
MQARRNLITIVRSPSRGLARQQSAEAVTLVEPQDVLKPRPDRSAAERVSGLVGSADTAVRSWLSDPRRYAPERSVHPVLRRLAIALAGVLAAIGSVLTLIAVGTN